MRAKRFQNDAGKGLPAYKTLPCRVDAGKGLPAYETLPCRVGRHSHAAGSLRLVSRRALLLAAAAWPALGWMASTPIVVIVHPSMPVKTVKDLVALARQRPGDINVASAGNGTFTHLSGELFRSTASVKWTHVPYKGAPVALADVVSGQLQVMFSSLPAAVGLITGGRLKALAVSTVKRSETLPLVPTVAESGVPGYEVIYWYGLFAPAATPAEIVTRLHNETAQALRAPEVIASLNKQGAIPGAMSQPQFADFVRSEVAKWGKVVKASGAKVD